nr:TCR gamma alternate reading frame protein [Odocoileus virginianus texanus]
MKTNDTYMKFSWLTVTENSMKKEHVCIVKHEKNPGRKDQEILFPAVNEVFTPVVTTTEPPNDCLRDESEATDTDFTKACARDRSIANSTKACLKDENNTVPLQFTYNSAYYTYLVLLLKSAVYFAITSFCVFRRTGVCCDGTSS